MRRLIARCTEFVYASRDHFTSYIQLKMLMIKSTVEMVHILTSFTPHFEEDTCLTPKQAPDFTTKYTSYQLTYQLNSYSVYLVTVSESWDNSILVLVRVQLINIGGQHVVQQVSELRYPPNITREFHVVELYQQSTFKREIIAIDELYD